MASFDAPSRSVFANVVAAFFERPTSGTRCTTRDHKLGNA
jgi:hypothetical protein